MSNDKFQLKILTKLDWKFVEKELKTTNSSQDDFIITKYFEAKYCDINYCFYVVKDENEETRQTAFYHKKENKEYSFLLIEPYDFVEKIKNKTKNYCNQIY